MKLFKFKKRRSPATTAMLASAAFIALAVYAWDVPVSELLNTLLVLVVVLGGIILLALLCVALLKFLRR